jgi:hypothetical protein
VVMELGEQKSTVSYLGVRNSMAAALELLM